MMLCCAVLCVLLNRCAGCQQPMDLNGGSRSTFSVGQDGQPYHEACHKQLFHPSENCRLRPCITVVDFALPSRMHSSHAYYEYNAKLICSICQCLVVLRSTVQG